MHSLFCSTHELFPPVEASNPLGEVAQGSWGTSQRPQPQKHCDTNRGVLQYKWDAYCDTNGRSTNSIFLSSERRDTESTAIQIGGVLQYRLAVYFGTSSKVVVVGVSDILLSLLATPAEVAQCGGVEAVIALSSVDLLERTETLQSLGKLTNTQNAPLIKEEANRFMLGTLFDDFCLQKTVFLTKAWWIALAINFAAHLACLNQGVCLALTT